LRIYLRNKAPFGLGWTHLSLVKGSAVHLDTAPPPFRIEGKSETGLTAKLTVEAAGHPFLHGAVLTVRGGLGFIEMQAYFPIPLELRVFPTLALPTAHVIHSARVGAPHARTGAHRLRFTGFGGELREIREHRPGDPFKQIAWKPTARLRRLMVKEYESEILMTHHLVLDISSTMRDRRPGRSKLDYGVNFGASYVRQALDVGDRVGLATVDSRIYGHIKPAEGRPQLLRIIEHLMELHHVIDADLIDITSMELVETVASYLIFQEGIDPRPRNIPPSHSDLWQDILPGPSGQLYNVRVIDAWASSLLSALRKNPKLCPHWLRMERTTQGDIEEGDPRLKRLRQICRLRGIEIPYRTTLLPGRKTRGLTEAIRKIAAQNRSHFILIISDLKGMEIDSGLRSALKLAKRRLHDVAVVCPFAPYFDTPGRVESVSSERSGRLNERFRLLNSVFEKEEYRCLLSTIQTLAGLGIRVDLGGPDKLAGGFWSHLGRSRARRRGMAA
jgi:uncharacterized protein (DUF58 family)